ncbi:MAG: phosphatase PAP2 family protein [Chromatiales bacterium]|nr:phosphatase PAP2 family protein [Chromatiales bacterium]
MPLALTDADRIVAGAWAFDAVAGRFIGAGPGEWWARELIHAGGGTAIRIAGAAALLLWLLSRWSGTLAAWRRPLAYVVAATLSIVTVIGVAKNTTNVDCPWSITGYGGSRPYVHLFADRPDGLPRARCFPGGHSASGFTLLALYFALRDRRPRAARSVLAAALGVGALFAFGQEARGAHFLSHDLWSLAIAWFTCLGVYRLGFGGRV